MATRTITLELPEELAERLEKSGVLENTSRLTHLFEAELHRQGETPDMEAELQPFLAKRKQEYPDLPEHNQRILAVADLLMATDMDEDDDWNETVNFIKENRFSIPAPDLGLENG